MNRLLIFVNADFSLVKKSDYTILLKKFDNEAQLLKKILNMIILKILFNIASDCLIGLLAMKTQIWPKLTLFPLGTARLSYLMKNYELFWGDQQ